MLILAALALVACYAAPPENDEEVSYAFEAEEDDLFARLAEREAQVTGVEQDLIDHLRDSVDGWDFTLRSFGSGIDRDWARILDSFVIQTEVR
jgi:hypothetical protein